MPYWLEELLTYATVTVFWLVVVGLVTSVVLWPITAPLWMMALR